MLWTSEDEVHTLASTNGVQNLLTLPQSWKNPSNQGSDSQSLSTQSLSTSPALDGMQERLAAEVARRESAEARILELEATLQAVAERDMLLCNQSQRRSSPPLQREFHPAVGEPKSSLHNAVPDSLRTELATLKAERSSLLSYLSTPVDGESMVAHLTRLASVFEKELALTERAGAQRAAIVWQSQLKEMNGLYPTPKCAESPRVQLPQPRAASRREREDSMPAESPRALRNSLTAARRERDELRRRVSLADTELSEVNERVSSAQERSNVLQDELRVERAQRGQMDEQTQQQAKAFEERLLFGEQQMDQLAARLTHAHHTLEQQLQDEATRRRNAEERVQALTVELVAAQQTPREQSATDDVAEQLQANLEARLAEVGNEGVTKKNLCDLRDAPQLADLELMCQTALRSHAKSSSDAVSHDAESLVKDLSNMDRELSVVEADAKEKVGNYLDLSSGTCKDETTALRKKLALAESIAKQVVAGRPGEEHIPSLQAALAAEKQRRLQAEAHAMLLRTQLGNMQKQSQANVTNVRRQTSNDERHVVSRSQSLNNPAVSLCSAALLENQLQRSRPPSTCATPRRERSTDDFTNRSSIQRESSVNRMESLNICKSDLQVLPAPTAVVHRTRYLPPSQVQMAGLTPRGSIRQTSPTRVLVTRSVSLPRFGTASTEVSPSPRSGSACATPPRASSPPPPNHVATTPPTPGLVSNKVVRSFSATTQKSANVRVVVSSESKLSSPGLQFRAPVLVPPAPATSRSSAPASVISKAVSMSGGSSVACRSRQMQVR